MIKQAKRPEDWGQREAHPLYSRWVWHKNRTSTGVVDEWRADFWVFVAGVGGNREGEHLRRIKPKDKMGPDNFKWVKPDSNDDKAAYQRVWRKKNHRTSRSYDLQRAYGITADDYDAMFEAQGGVCAICKNPEDHKRDGRYVNLTVDHCHDKGHVRGLLCNRCNRGIGLLGEDVAALRRAIVFLGG